MKLDVKIFLGTMAAFSIIILIGGYVLLSFFYDTTMNRENQAALEGYQYNKFVVQSKMLTESKWEKSEENKLWSSSISEEFSGKVALFSEDFSQIYNCFDGHNDFVSLLEKVGNSEISYEFQKIGNHRYLLMSGMVEERGKRIYLVSGIDVEGVIELWQQMKDKVLWVYCIAIGISVCLSMGLSVLFSRKVRILTVGAEKIANGQYGNQITIRGKDEIGQLARNFNQMSMAVQEKVEELSETARQREDFVSNFAHELKTPLTSIIGYADRIYQKDLPEEERKAAAWYIWNEGMRLEALSRKLMDLILLSHHDFMLETVSVHDLFRELMEDTSYQLAEKNVSLTRDLKNSYVKIEHDLFKTLFYNLLDNAIKAGAKHISIRGEREVEGAFYRIEISDDGRGIPPGEIERITEAFYMVDKSRSRKLHGAGLGLALAQKVTEIHGSTLEFQSDGKTGTTVCFSLKTERLEGGLDE